jgi:hypothetical protein
MEVLHISTRIGSVFFDPGGLTRRQNNGLIEAGPSFSDDRGRVAKYGA